MQGQVQPDPHNTTALILCGGAGRRVGGADKPLLEWHGEPMIAHVLTSVRKQVAQVLISANRNLETYRQWAPVVTDAPLESRSPLTGVLRGMTQADTPWLWVCPGDAPKLAADCFARLAAQTAAPVQVATAHDGEREQWLHMLVNTALAGALESYLNGGGYSVHRWLGSLPPHTHLSVDCAAIADSFANFNRPEDLSG